MSGGVTFRDFAELAKRKGWSVQFLAEAFRGRIEDPSEFFHRVLTCQYRGEDRSWAVIPYLSVVDFYCKEVSPLVTEGSVRLCGCMCGMPVYGRKIYNSAACRKRVERGRSETPKSGSKTGNKDGTFPVTISAP